MAYWFQRCPWTGSTFSPTGENALSVPGATVHLTVGVSGSCLSSTTASDSYYQSVNGNPTTATAGLDQTTCAGSVTLGGNAPINGTGEWSVVSGSFGFFGDPSSPTTIFAGSAGTTYTLRWTISTGTCGSSSDDVIVTFNNGPSTAQAGADQTGQLTCGLTTVTMAGNTPTSGIGSWTVVSGTGGSFANASSPTSTFTGTTGSTYTLRWTISTSACGSSSDDVIVAFNRNPTTANAGVDQISESTCGLTTVTMAGNTPTNGTGSWSVVNGSGGSFGNASSPTSTFSGIGGSTYTLRWTISSNPCASSFDDVVVKLNMNPTAANAGPDQGTCGLTTVTLAGNASNNGTGSWSVVSGTGGSFANASSPTSAFSGTSGSTYTLRWTITSSLCGSSSDDVRVSFNNNPTTANAGPDQTGESTCGLTTITLAGNTPTNGAGSWSVVSGTGGSFANVSSPTSAFTGAAGSSYTLRWTVTTSTCGTSTDEVAIKFNVLSDGGALGPNLESCGVASGQLTLTDYTGDIQRWWKKPSSGLWTEIASATSTLAYDNITTTTTYYAEVKNGVCATANSNEAVITIRPLPSMTVQGQTALAPGGKTTLVAESGLYSYEWFKDDLPISGETLRQLVVNKPGNYKVAVRTASTDPVCSSEDIIVKEAISDQLTSLNYIVSTEFLREGVTTQTDLYDLRPMDLTQVVDYFDGLGRPMQKVTVGTSPMGNDMVMPIDYDEYGREPVKYLPYARTVREGAYVSTSLTDQSNFYQSAEKIEHDGCPFAKTVFEQSPLNRILKSGSPGTAWQPDESLYSAPTDRVIHYEYESNTTDEVLLWSYARGDGDALGLVNATSPSGVMLYYDQNSLYENKTKDEQFNEIIEYIDKQGRTVLKKVQLDATYANILYL